MLGYGDSTLHLTFLGGGNPAAPAIEEDGAVWSTWSGAAQNDETLRDAMVRRTCITPF